MGHSRRAKRRGGRSGYTAKDSGTRSCRTQNYIRATLSCLASALLPSRRPSGGAFTGICCPWSGGLHVGKLLGM